MNRHFEVVLTDNGDDENMSAEINVGKNTTPEMLDDMIQAFENIREGMYEKARKRVKEYAKDSFSCALCNGGPDCNNGEDCITK